MTPSSPLFGLRELKQLGVPGYIVRDAATGELELNQRMHNGHLVLPALFGELEARALVKTLASRGLVLELVQSHGPCPKCERAIGVNDLDFLYNSQTGWEAACHEWAGGCGHVAHGASKNEALRRWGSPHLRPGTAH